MDGEMAASKRLHEGRRTGRTRKTMRGQPALFSTSFRLIPKPAQEGGAYLVLSGDGCILYANPEAKEIFGPDLADMIGMPFATPDELRQKTEIEVVRDHRVCRAEMVVTETIYQGLPAYQVTLVDVTRLWNLVEELTACAIRDPLTGLLNRAAVMDRIEARCLADPGETRPFCVVYVDLNDFKHVNDSYGHLAGDSVLREAAQRLGALMGPQDALARIGGDEFLALLDGPEAAKRAAAFPDLVKSAFRPPFVVQDRPFHLGASCGAALFPEDGKDGEELIANADLRMYRVKGGLSVKKSTQPPATSEELARDILAGQLRIRCQPQVFFSEREAIAAEARCYWEHPRLGLVRAGSFLGVAEKSDLIVAVDEFVLNHACHLLRTWREEGVPIRRLAMNVSAASLARPGWVDLVGKALADKGVAPGSLELEVPDSLELSDMVCDVLGALRNSGVRVAVDSFGSGPRSLQWIRHLPVDTLKIDRGLVAGFLQRPTHRALVEAFVMMGNSLNFTVIAEGVESAEELAALESLGCHAVQGFAISDALAEADLREFARANPVLTRQRRNGIGLRMA